MSEVQLAATAVLRRVRAHLDEAGYPIEMRLAPGPTGWPLAAVLRSGLTRSPVVLGEFEQEPLAEVSVESMAAVIAGNVRALYDEWVETTDDEAADGPRS